MIPINGSNSSGVDLNKYVLKNVFNTVVNDLSDNVNKNKIDIEDIKNKVDAANDKFEWLAFDVSSEYTEEYNMKRCFNKYGDSFLIRETTITQLQDYEIHDCEVNTIYGPNIQYKFISDYVYLPAYIRDKDNDKIIYHIVNCSFVLNQDTVNCSCKRLEFGEGWNNIIVKNSDTIEYVKINSDCNAIDISNNSELLKDINLIDCYKLTGVHINNNPNFKNKCFLMSCTPSTFSTNNNNNTYLDITQNWFSSDGLWRCKFIAGWHAQDINLYDRFSNRLRARVDDASNDTGFYKTDINDSVINTDYFKFPSTITFSNDLYNANRTVHIPGVQVSVYTDATFTTQNMVSNARILDFSNGIIKIMWDNDNKVEKMIVSPSLTELEIKNNIVLSSINLVDCDKLTILTIQNCPNITQVILQHRPTTLNLDSTIKLIVLDEMNNSITTNTNNLTTINNNITSLGTRITTLENKPQTTYSRYTIENYETRPGDPEVQRLNMYFAFSYVKKITDNETGYIYYWDNGNKILFEAVDNDENPNTHLLPSCPNIGLAWYEFYVSGPQDFNYNQPYTAVAGFDLSNGAITTFKIAKLDAPWDRIYIPPTVHTFEMIECFQLVGGETDPPVEIIKFPSTGFINTDTDPNKIVVKTVSLTASV